jgi:hypothetical protein
MIWEYSIESPTIIRVLKLLKPECQDGCWLPPIRETWLANSPR